jgi:outer membrane protein assembly factor BamB
MATRADRLRVERRRAVRRRRLVVMLLLVFAAGAAVVWRAGRDGEPRGQAAAAVTSAAPRTGTAAATTLTSTIATAPPAPTATEARPDVLVDPASSGQPWGDVVEGLLTFRGNPTRSYHGRGPVPADPVVRWRYPERAMCGESSDGEGTRVWCGTGWTGQPAVFERDGRTWVVFGAYDYKVHFVDAATGADILAPFPTGDIIKGSVTVDPDGYPLVYTGSRDNAYRVIAIDRPEPTELWRLTADAVSPTMWNNDWDGSGLVVADHLVEGGENSQLHVVRLHRGYGPDGLVTVAPELVFHAPGWDDELLAALPDGNVSIENSVAIVGDTVYFSNSGGLVQGWDLSSLRTGAGVPQRTFRFWVGDDTDATIVADDEGMLYVDVEYERGLERARSIGQVLKLDPGRPDDPVVWSVPLQRASTDGVWATAALHRDLVIVPTHLGTVLGLDRSTGAVRWEKDLPGPTWSSPAVVDDVWIQGDCAGVLHAFDVSDTAIEPPELWSIELGGCIESTPAVWDGAIYVGTRAGFVHAVGDST